jgi:hypothetical protein
MKQFELTGNNFDDIQLKVNLKYSNHLNKKSALKALVMVLPP